MPERRPYPYKQVPEESAASFALLGLDAWPPKECPTPSTWWMEPQKVMPARTDTPGIILFDVIGTPKSGKSTVCKELTKILGQYYFVQGTPWQIKIWDEPYQKVSPDHAFATLPRFVSGDDQNFRIGNDMPGSMALQRIKTFYWAEHVRDAYTLNWQGRHINMGYRGAFDNLVWAHALATHRASPGYEHVPYYHNYLGHISATDLFNLPYCTAIIAFGTSQEVAQKRSLSGWVANSPLFPELSAWYGDFLLKKFAKYHELFRFGRLILNGEEPINANITKIMTYVEEICRARENQISATKYPDVF